MLEGVAEAEKPPAPKLVMEGPVSGTSTYISSNASVFSTDKKTTTAIKIVTSKNRELTGQCSTTGTSKEHTRKRIDQCWMEILKKKKKKKLCQDKADAITSYDKVQDKIVHLNNQVVKEISSRRKEKKQFEEKIIALNKKKLQGTTGLDEENKRLQDVVTVNLKRAAERQFNFAGLW
ncbi:hypothetical protein RJT34_26543 [Clitoria ternatea]|uniref:Uncharacterized protein n=1 Tax=Clitoria ternatea TaxID=43366 RepID=A0AAN9IBM2_CLITE